MNENHGKTIIVIEHHTEYIADYCKHVMLMKDGQVRWMLPTEEALQRVEELEECNIFPPQVTQAAHRLRRAGRLPAGIPLPTTVEGGKNRLRQTALYLPGTSGASCPRRRERSLLPGRIFGLPLGEGGAPHRVRRPEPEHTEGGKGGSHRLQRGGQVHPDEADGGLLKPQAGTVSLFGEAIGDKKAEDLSRQISLVYQNPEEMFIKDSIRADIAYAMEVRKVPEWEKRTAELLERFRLTELADRDGRLMSCGQMRRASLAIGIALNPGILLLDEPTANLDIATRREIMGVLSDMKDIIQTAVIATHDMQLVCQWAERIIVLCNGQVVADGPRDEIFARTDVVEQVGIRPPEIFTMGQALDRRALCYTIDEFLSSFQEA